MTNYLDHAARNPYLDVALDPNHFQSIRVLTSLSLMLVELHCCPGLSEDGQLALLTSVRRAHLDTKAVASDLFLSPNVAKEEFQRWKHAFADVVSETYCQRVLRLDRQVHYLGNLLASRTVAWMPSRAKTEAA